MKRPGVKRILLSVVILLLCSATAWLWSAHEAGRAELRALCERDGQPRVYRQVAAEGYFDGAGSCYGRSCFSMAIRTPFKYIEIEHRKRGSLPAVLDDGIYRLSRVRQDSGLCDQKILEAMRDSHYAKEFLSSGMCIRAERLEAVEARFGFFAERQPPLKIQNRFDSVIASTRFYIADRESGELVAEQYSYYLHQNTMPRFSSFSTLLHCASDGISVAPRPPHLNRIFLYLKPE